MCVYRPPSETHPRWSRNAAAAKKAVHRMLEDWIAEDMGSYLRNYGIPSRFLDVEIFHPQKGTLPKTFEVALYHGVTVEALVAKIKDALAGERD